MILGIGWCGCSDAEGSTISASSGERLVSRYRSIGGKVILAFS